MSKKIRCGECGSHQLEEREQIGKPFPFKDYPAVILNRSFSALECRACGNLVVNQKQVRDLDAAIEFTNKDDVVNFITTLLARENTTIKELGNTVGLSREYLSKLKAGETIPKFQTYNMLKVLFSDKNSFKLANPKYDGFRKDIA
ncbi:MAG: hypothetical protein CL674_00930 [Bdellovibrionaceae bacterium]|nr:hypothetical protein [Pseudobdellovibrionaceae bacterium]|tara:strand:+ start:4018 stop:4452 length:435 start_codon:yes stop_codon:yes gene_type:complete